MLAKKNLKIGGRMWFHGRRMREMGFLASKEYTWSRFGLAQQVEEALVSSTYQHPSEVQVHAVPVLMDASKDVIVKAETGSGKTLAYLVPLISRLLQANTPPSEHPSLVILVPSRELVDQVFSTIASLFPSVLPMTRAVVGNRGPTPKDRYLIAVGTPQAIVDSISVESLRLCGAIVVDEADMLLGGAYARYTVNEILRKTRSGECGVSRPQHIFVGATLPANGARKVIEGLELKGKRRSGRSDVDWLVEVAVRAHVMSDTLTRCIIGCSIDESLFDSDAALAASPSKDPGDVFLVEEELRLLREEAIREQKLAAVTRVLGGNEVGEEVLLGEGIVGDAFGRVVCDLEEGRGEMVEVKELGRRLREEFGVILMESDPSDRPVEILTPPESTIVFCGSNRSASFTASFLQARSPSFKVASTAAKKGRDHALQLFQSGEAPVLVTTDVFARGVDFLEAKMVIEADVATDAVAHLHRAGRTARKGQSGALISIAGPDDTPLLASLLHAQLFHGSLEAAFSKRRSLRRKLKKVMEGREEN